MRNPLRAGTLAASLLLGTAIVIPVTTEAIAQDHVSISFGVFHDRLSGYGDWVYSDRWGEVWVPADVSEDFHPYDTNGHWVYTDYYGWMWVSDYEWGDIAFHYGRWVDDPDAGWMWIPGYVWSPAWVVWRSNRDYAGWMPMPPDEQFLSGASFGMSGGGISFGIDFGNTGGYYGYSRWYPDYDEDRFASNWVFVRKGYIADRHFRRYVAPRNNYRMLLRNTRDVTHYTVQNNYVVNRSIAVRDVERASGHRIQHVEARTVIRNPQFITNVNVGSDLQKRARSERPHGTGVQGSAPKPPPQVINSLSPNLRNTHIRNKQNFFTRQNVEQGNFGHGGENNAGPTSNNPPGQTNNPSGHMGNEDHRGPHQDNGPANNNPPGQTNNPSGHMDMNGPGNEDHHGQHQDNGPANNNPPTPPDMQHNMPGSETHHGTHEETGPNNNPPSPGEQHTNPVGTPPLPNNPQSGSGGTGTPETPHGVHEREHHPAPGSETNQPNNSGNQGPPPNDNHGDHMNTENPHAVHDRNPPTLPGAEPTPQPDHGQPPPPPEKGKHHDKGDNGQGDNGDNDKKKKHDENGQPQ